MNLIRNTSEFTEALQCGEATMQFPANANLLLCDEPFAAERLDALDDVAGWAGRSLHLH